MTFYVRLSTGQSKHNTKGDCFECPAWHCSVYVFLIPFYLRAVHVHIANGVNLKKA
jgi:hypothetical protein